MRRQRYAFDGGHRTLAEISDLSGVPFVTLHGRVVKRGLSIAEAVSQPVRRPRTYTFAGKNLTLAEWARETGISEKALFERIRQNSWPLERALTEPSMGRGERITFNRNRAIVSRIAHSFREKAVRAGGYPQIFDPAQGTGVGRHETDFEGVRP